MKNTGNNFYFYKYIFLTADQSKRTQKESSESIHLSPSSREAAFEALITEYKLNHDHIISRDQMMRQLERYAITIIGASFGLLKFIEEKDVFVIFPAISILIIAIASAHRSQRNLARRLNWYQYNILKPMLDDFIQGNNELNSIPESTKNLWSWQKHKDKYREGQPVLFKAIRNFVFPGLNPLMVFSSLFFLLLSLSHARTNEISSIGYFFLTANSIYFLWYLLVLLRFSYWVTLKFGPHDYMN